MSPFSSDGKRWRRFPLEQNSEIILFLSLFLVVLPFLGWPLFTLPFPFQGSIITRYPRTSPPIRCALLPLRATMSGNCLSIDSFSPLYFLVWRTSVPWGRVFSNSPRTPSPFKENEGGPVRPRSAVLPLLLEFSPSPLPFQSGQVDRQNPSAQIACELFQETQLPPFLATWIIPVPV